MSRNSEAWRDRQRKVLVALRGSSSQEEASRRIGLGYWRYVHLEQAKTRLSSEEFWLFAEAYDLTPFDLARRLGYPIEGAATGFEARLRERGVPEEAIRELLSDSHASTLLPAAQEQIARWVAEDERDHPRRTQRRANSC